MGLLQDLREWFAQRSYTIKYEITGQVDGRWVVKAFDGNGKPLGNQVIVNSPGDAWKVYMLLNGYHYGQPIKGLEMEKAS